jgi:hypothetical protein
MNKSKRVVWLMCLASSLMVFGGSFMTWISLSVTWSMGSFEDRGSGIEGDGQITVVLAVITWAVLAWYWLANGPRLGHSVLLAVLGALTATLAGVDLIDSLSPQDELIAELSPDSEAVIKIGLGLYLVLAGGLAMLASGATGAALALRELSSAKGGLAKASDQAERPPTSPPVPASGPFGGTPWWVSRVVVVATLLLAFPVGVWLMWRHAPWPRVEKWAWSIGSILVLIISSVVLGIGTVSERGDDSAAAAIHGSWILWDGVGGELIVFDAEGNVLAKPASPSFESAGGSIRDDTLIFHVDGMQGHDPEEPVSLRYKGTRLAEDEIVRVLPEGLTLEDVEMAFFGQFERTDMPDFEMAGAAIKLLPVGIAQYREECPVCGFSIVVDELQQDVAENRFRVRVSITNTGENGNVDLSATNAAVYALSRKEADQFSELFEAELAKGGVKALLSSFHPATFEFQGFLDVAETPPCGSVLAPGESCESMLVFEGIVPPGTAAIILAIDKIHHEFRTIAWFSYQEGEPFIRVERRR